MKRFSEDQPKGRPSWVTGEQLGVRVQGVSEGARRELVLTMPGQRVQSQDMIEPIQAKTILSLLSPISA